MLFGKRVNYAGVGVQCPLRGKCWQDFKWRESWQGLLLAVAAVCCLARGTLCRGKEFSALSEILKHFLVS